LKYIQIVPIALLLAACGERTAVTTSAPTTTVTSERTVANEDVRQPTPPESSASVAREIYIDEISGTNPVIVTGRARTFENAVSLRLRDANGRLLTEEHVTSVGEMGQHNRFEAQLWVTRAPGASFTVEAFEYSAKDGSVRSLTRKTVRYDAEHIAFDLAFPKGDCTRIARFRRRFPKSMAMARLLTEALLAGPTDEEVAEGAQRAFPAGADVNAVVLRDGVLTVDLNERMQNVGGSCAAQAARQSLTETLRQLPTVRRVVITAAGSEALALQP
jgi:Immunoglobulin-like domain of bacterial spore germination/Sporulation and spore germination